MLRQVFQYDPIIGYRFIPGLKTRVLHEGGGYLVRVNDSGFRCEHNFICMKIPGYRRILLFGDSMTAGDGVSNKSRFGDLLEKSIKYLEIYNFALPGTGTGQHYLTYKEISAGIDHDLLIIALFVDNIRRVAAHSRYFDNEKGETVTYEKPYYELIDGYLILKNVPPRKEPILESTLSKNQRRHIDRGQPVPQLLKRLVSFTRQRPTLNRIFITGGFKDLIQKMLRYQVVPEYDNPCNPAWLLMRAILEKWIANHRAPVILMPIPSIHHVMEISRATQYQSRMQEIAFTAGCILHDPLPDLFKYPRTERRSFYFEMDGHLTPRGHRAIADSMEPVIENLLRNS